MDAAQLMFQLNRKVSQGKTVYEALLSKKIDSETIFCYIFERGNSIDYLEGETVESVLNDFKNYQIINKKKGETY